MCAANTTLVSVKNCVLVLQRTTDQAQFPLCPVGVSSTDLPANLRLEVQILPGATQILGMVHDTHPVQLVHGHLDVVGVGPEKDVHMSELTFSSSYLQVQANLLI